MMLAAVAALPDAVVGLTPVVEDEVGDAAEKGPLLLVQLADVPLIEVRGVDDLAVDVQLELSLRLVADADGPGAAVAVQLRELDLGEASLPAEAVHELQIARAARGAPVKPLLICPRGLGEAQNKQAIEGKGGVPGSR